MADVLFAAGSNPFVAHPVIASAVMRAKHEGGAKIIVADPRRTELAARADLWLRLKPGSNVALLNSIAHVILDEGLADLAFIEARTENFGAFAANLEAYAPEETARLTGVEPELVRRAARMYGRGQRGMLLWGMGITQHLKGVDGAMAMANLSLLTGHVGRPGTGFHAATRPMQRAGCVRYAGARQCPAGLPFDRRSSGAGDIRESVGRRAAP